LDDQLAKTPTPLIKTQLDKYREFVRAVVRQGNVLDKKFYIAIPFSSLELGAASTMLSLGNKRKTLPVPKKDVIAKATLNLVPKRDHLVRLLARIGLRARQLATPELTQLFFDFYNRGQLGTRVNASLIPTTATPADPAKKTLGELTDPKDILAPEKIDVDFNTMQMDGTYFRTLFVSGYPRFVSANWLSPLINFDHSLNIAMFVYPVESKSTLDDLRRKIAEMEAELSTDMQRGKVVDPFTQAKLEDALSLQEQLAKGSERFFQNCVGFRPSQQASFEHFGIAAYFHYPRVPAAS
jgi:hypothetical protein